MPHFLAQIWEGLGWKVASSIDKLHIYQLVETDTLSQLPIFGDFPAEIYHTLRLVQGK